MRFCDVWVHGRDKCKSQSAGWQGGTLNLIPVCDDIEKNRQAIPLPFGSPDVLFRWHTVKGNVIMWHPHAHIPTGDARVLDKIYAIQLLVCFQHGIG